MRFEGGVVWLHGNTRQECVDKLLIENSRFDNTVGKDVLGRMKGRSLT